MARLGKDNCMAKGETQQTNETNFGHFPSFLTTYNILCCYVYKKFNIAFGRRSLEILETTQLVWYTTAWHYTHSLVGVLLAYVYNTYKYIYNTHYK